MTERIQHIIDGIRLKCKALYSQLESERAIRATQEAELVQLKEENSTLLTEKNELGLEIEKLKSELNTIEKQRIDERESAIHGRNEEIDDLVREIEHCINQLKQ